jgi:hypothetical protein
VSSNSDTQIVDALYAIGLHLLGEERILEAADVFRALMLQAPRDERGWLGLTECHRVRGEIWIGRELLGVATLLVGATPRIEMAQRALSAPSDSFTAAQEAAS